jgi:hypothetical protein
MILSLGEILSIEQSVDLLMKANAWKVRRETRDFEIIKGEDEIGRFTLTRGLISGESLLVRESLSI